MRSSCARTRVVSTDLTFLGCRCGRCVLLGRRDLRGDGAMPDSGEEVEENPAQLGGGPGKDISVSGSEIGSESLYMDIRVGAREEERAEEADDAAEEGGHDSDSRGYST